MAQVMAYYTAMARRGRLVLITDDHGECYGALAFFLLPGLEDVERFHRHKKKWEASADTEYGTVLYVDQLYTTAWTSPIRRRVQAILEEQFPQVELGVWYRPAGKHRDRRVIVRRSHHGAEV